MAVNYSDPEMNSFVQQKPSHQSNDRNHQRLMGILWMVVLFGTLSLFLLGSLLVPQDISKAERRKLALWPQASLKTVASGSWQQKVERFTNDHLFERDRLLSLHALSSTLLYGAQDQNGFVVKDGHLIEVQRSISQDSLFYAADLFTKIYRNDLEGTDCRIYFSIIPDKSYFLEHNAYLNMDYDVFFQEVRDIFAFGQEVPIADTMRLDQYYCTDPHWRQEAIFEQAQKLAAGMGVTLKDVPSEVTLADSFTGQQALLSAYPHGKDALKALWTDSMKNWTIIRYDEKGVHESVLYDRSKTDSVDPYSVFLSGSAGMVEIINPQISSDRELILFSDSYGSSIAPLLAMGYHRTMLVDLRNLPSYALKKYIDFTDQDVLFLYSTSVLNSAQTLK